jgi:hypothetical protein
LTTDDPPQIFIVKKKLENLSCSQPVWLAEGVMSSSDSEDDEAPEMVTREVAEAEEESRQKRENRDGTNKKKKREAEAKRKRQKATPDEPVEEMLHDNSEASGGNDESSRKSLQMVTRDAMETKDETDNRLPDDVLAAAALEMADAAAQRSRERTQASYIDAQGKEQVRRHIRFLESVKSRPTNQRRDDNYILSVRSGGSSGNSSSTSKKRKTAHLLAQHMKASKEAANFANRLMGGNKCSRMRRSLYESQKSPIHRPAKQFNRKA